jgi:hypothetical protein
MDMIPEEVCCMRNHINKPGSPYGGHPVHSPLSAPAALSPRPAMGRGTRRGKPGYNALNNFARLFTHENETPGEWLRLGP